MSRKPNLAMLQKTIGYQFNDLSLLKQALTHRSAHHLHNERLEYLGDAVLGHVIALELYKRFPKADEGQLSRLRAFLVKEKALSELAKEMNFSDFLILGSGELKSGGFRRDSILSDTFEAIIGAVILDSDFETAQAYLLKLYQNKISQLSLDMAQKDPKTRLQEWLQARGQKIPDYQVIKEAGKDHVKKYWVECRIEYQQMVLQGEGASRRKAEQDAATKAIEKIQIDKNAK